MESKKGFSGGERKLFIQELTNNPSYSHAVYGCFKTSGGHRLQKVDGPSSLPRKLFKYEYPYLRAFGEGVVGQEFKARVLYGKTEQGESFFILIFLDRQGDSRPGSHTDYAITFPVNEPSETLDLIKSDPSVLIEIFQMRYPAYDKSSGQLALDPNTKPLEYKPPVLK